jgi:hypothetical protein
MTATIRRDCYSSIKVEAKIRARSTNPSPLLSRFPQSRGAFAAAIFSCLPGSNVARNVFFNTQSKAGVLSVKLCKAPIPAGFGM